MNLALDTALTADDKQRLLRLARAAVVAAVEVRPRPELAPAELTEGLLRPLGAFVTLERHEELRGCIGRMQFDRPLHLNLVEAAESAARQDPRFLPVTGEELPEIRIEVSVIEEPQPIANIEQFDPLQHGIVMERGFAHGVFLPKVARAYGWDRPTTLRMLCRKIGLPEDAWLDTQTAFKVFRAIEFAES